MAKHQVIISYLIVYMFTRGFATKTCVTQSLHDWNFFPQISRWFPPSTHPYHSSTIILHNSFLFPFSHFWDFFSRRKQFSWQRKDSHQEASQGWPLGSTSLPQIFTHTGNQSQLWKIFEVELKYWGVDWALNCQWVVFAEFQFVHRITGSH